ncbi:MAG: cobalamin-dependent protein [Sedimentisphaerales bacterium]|nr:cobalamin-dependent protein [Sedimentisphaerales bacterium]
MITLININRMTPPVAPIGLDYLADHLRQSGIHTDLLDLALVADPDQALRSYFAVHQPELVGLTFRNIDDCFWPSAQWFVPELSQWIAALRSLTEAPLVLGGVGFSVQPERILAAAGADFGIHGDGEQALVQLCRFYRRPEQYANVPGLLWWDGGAIRRNGPAWPMNLTLSSQRHLVDNPAYFARGGQCGLETKRGCHRQCIYCVDPLAKGKASRLRDPNRVADEVEALLARGIDVLHICDSEFNLPYSHALAVCDEFQRRQLGRKVRWYAYLAVSPFDVRLARALRQAGCVGVDFTGDAGCDAMLRQYRQHHTCQDLARAVRLCRENRIAVMVDLLLGGPGETTQTLAESIEFMRRIEPDCVGASLGIRVYPDTALAEQIAAGGDLQDNPHLKRKYSGPVDFLRPTFYLSRDLGAQPAQRVRDCIAGDTRFFAPRLEEEAAAASPAASDHNYNDNDRLVAAIENGARGAYWDILRKLPHESRSSFAAETS